MPGDKLVPADSRACGDGCCRLGVCYAGSACWPLCLRGSQGHGPGPEAQCCHQIGDGSGWQRMRGFLVFKPNAPSLKDPVLALDVSNPLRGVCTWDRNTQEHFSGTCKHVGTTQSRGKPVLPAVGTLRAPSWTQTPPQLDPRPVAESDLVLGGPERTRPPRLFPPCPT